MLFTRRGLRERRIDAMLNSYLAMGFCSFQKFAFAFVFTFAPVAYAKTVLIHAVGINAVERDHNFDNFYEDAESSCQNKGTPSCKLEVFPGRTGALIFSIKEIGEARGLSDYGIFNFSLEMDSAVPLGAVRNKSRIRLPC